MKKKISFGVVDMGSESFGAVYIKPRSLGSYHSDLGLWQVATGMEFYPLAAWEPIEVPNPREHFELTGF
jgi:hypothetical protein